MRKEKIEKQREEKMKEAKFNVEKIKETLEAVKEQKIQETKRSSSFLAGVLMPSSIDAAPEVDVEDEFNLLPSDLQDLLSINPSSKGTPMLQIDAEYDPEKIPFSRMTPLYSNSLSKSSSSVVRPSTADIPLCSFALNGNCKIPTKCRMIYGLLCE